MKFFFLFFFIFSTLIYSQDNNITKTMNNSSWDNGILFFRSGKDYSLRFDTRMFFDYAKYSGSDYAYSGSDLRRGRFALKTILFKKWYAEFDIEFADNAPEVKDMWVGRFIGEHSIFKIGQFKVPFSMEELTSSLIITFMERSLTNALTSSRRLSIGYDYWWDFGQVSSSLFSQEISDSKDVIGDEALGFALRGSVAFVKDDMVFHLGGGSFIETTENDTHELKIKAYPETKVSKVRYLNTGKLKDVEYNSVSNIELAFSYKFIRFQAEYMINKVLRMNNKRDLTFSGYYFYLAAFLTGEVKPYSVMAGEFLPIVPKRDFGAIELAFRISSLDLNDVAGPPHEDKIEGGMSTQYTVGLTWFFNTNFRLMFNYSYSDNSKWADGDGDYIVPTDGIKLHIFQSRFIANF